MHQSRHLTASGLGKVIRAAPAVVALVGHANAQNGPAVRAVDEARIDKVGQIATDCLQRAGFSANLVKRGMLR